MTDTNGASPRPKVLIPEKVSPDGLRMLQASLEVHEKKGLSADELYQIIGEYDALIVRSETKVTSSLLAAGKKLRVVARAGVVSLRGLCHTRLRQKSHRRDIG